MYSERWIVDWEMISPTFARDCARCHVEVPGLRVHGRGGHGGGLDGLLDQLPRDRVALEVPDRMPSPGRAR